MDTLFLVRLRRVEWCFWSFGIDCQATPFGELRIIVWPVPIAAPFPNVAGHVVKAVTIGRKLRDRRDPGKTIFASVFHREFSLPGVRHPFSSATEFVAPGVGLPRQPATRGEFKLCFCWQTFA